MATNSIKIFDDTVIKLSVNQGLEAQRSAEVLGNFTNGELAFTRDTARLFVGDNSDGEPGHNGLQETIGGSLVGNKYLGLIDSKPLVPYDNNGEPLSYEETTSYTLTQEQANMVEPGLLTAQSKFRLHSTQDADEKWDNWDRTATYNAKYNAYNGDFMFDVYKNAFILFDNRISGEKESPTQPQIKLGSDGLPVSPETFIVNGKEIPSNSTQALSLTRRTILQNYAKDNQETTHNNMIYGDGYVVMRVIEPDNQTIRFKPKAFQQNGLPETENNYNHNIIEVFHVPAETILGYFSDDFYNDGEIIFLNKDIKNVKSITGDNNRLKLPGNLCFSTPKGDGRGAITYMKWELNEPKGITLPTDKKYRLTLTPSSKTTEDSKEYITFKGDMEEIKPCAYTINLQGGLFSNQPDITTLVIDEQATNPDKLLCPTLTYIPEEDDAILYGYDDDPYLLYKDLGDMYYTGNFGYDPTGKLWYIDEYSPSYRASAKDKIAKWEEENTSINYLKTPVTIAQSSSATNLFDAVAAPTSKTFTSSASSATISNSLFNNNVENLIKAVNAQNKLIFAHNKTTAAASGQSSATYTANTKTLTIPSITNTGVAVAFSSAQLSTNSYIKNVKVSGKLSGLNGYNGTCKLFCGLVSTSGSSVEIIKSQVIEQKFNNFLFSLSLDVEEVLLKNSSYVVTGIICDTTQTISNVTIVYDEFSYNSVDSLNAEHIFQLSDAGANILLDFNASPYLYCTKKIVSTPVTNVLPTPTTTVYPGSASGGAYFNNGFASSKTNIKVWNDLFAVIGHNNYKNVASPKTGDVIADASSVTCINQSAFKFISAYDYQEDTKSIKKHTTESDVDGESESYIGIAWYEYENEVSKEKRYTTYKFFNTFDEYTVLSYGDYYGEIPIDYMRICGDGLKDVYVFGGGNGDSTVPASEIIKGKTWRLGQMSSNLRRKAAIFLESSCFNGRQTRVEFGNKELGIASSYDFIKMKDYSLSNTIMVDDEEELKNIILIKNNTNAKEVTVDAAKLKNLGYKITNTTKISDISTDSSTELISSYDYCVLKYQEILIDETGAEPEIFYEPYNILKNIPFVIGYNEPEKLSGAAIYNNNNVSSVTLDETLSEDEKIYIPTTARSIILELTHITTENNTIGVFYSNRFEELGLILSGLPTQEYNDPAHFSVDIIINPSYGQAFSDAAYSNTNNTYKLKLGKSISTNSSAPKFHNWSQDVNANKSCVPSIYIPAPNERVLVNTSNTETRVIEVPLHKIPGSTTRHFSLRLANIRPSNAEILNQVVLRVLGYRA